MRITFATVNRNAQNNLSRRYSDMVSLQEQLATGKRLRKPSDDPVGVANAVKLRTKQTQIDQYKRNIEDGLASMGVASSAMASMNEMLHRARELAVQASNGTYNDKDRQYMQQEVDQIFRQMMSVINTQFKGNYIFNGTNTKTPPYMIETSGTLLTDYANRTMASYGEEIEISMRNAIDDHVAADVIYLDYNNANMKIGDTVQLKWSNPANADLNGTNLDYIIPESFPFDTYNIDIHGTGTPTTFTKDTDYAIDYRTGVVTILSEDFRDALNAISFGDRVANTGITYDVYNSQRFEADGTTPVLDSNGNPIYDTLEYSTNNTFQIVGGKYGEHITNIFPGSFSLKIGDKEYIEGFGEYKGDYYDENGALQKGKNKYDYTVDYETGKITIYNLDLLKDMRPWQIGGPGSPAAADDRFTPSDLEAYQENNMYKHGQLAMNFDYITRGVDIYGDKVSSQGDIARAIELGITVPINMGVGEMLRDIRSGNEMVGVFMRYSQALLKDDRDGIQNALDELTNMYDAVLNSQSKMGAQIYRFELTLERNNEQRVEVAGQLSALEDADLAEVISKLMLAENVYQAALQAAMRVIQPSLANYM